MKIRVSTIAFSNNKTLVNELKKHFKDVKVNEKGIRINENKLHDFYKDADGIIVGLEKITSELIEQISLELQKEDVKETIFTKIIDPIVCRITKKLYPYILVTIIVFILIILLMVLIVMNILKIKSTSQ